MTPLHQFGEMLRGVLSTIPLSFARVLFVALPLAVLLWVLRQPRPDDDLEQVPRGWSKDLRVWAAVALALQVAIYALV